MAESKFNPEGMVFRFQEGNLTELDEAKHWLIDKALTRFDGNKSQAARHLGMTYNGLLKLLQRK